MTDSSILVVTVMLASTLLARPLEPVAAQETTVDETAECRPAADLEPEASGGKVSRIRSTLSPLGKLLSWESGTGDTLRLRVFAMESGTYSLSLWAVHGPEGPVMSVKLWDDPLTSNGEKQIVFRRASGPEILAVRFDRVSLGPGHHILELSCLEPGELLLDCVALHRTGEMMTSRVRAQVGDDDGGRAFLGIRMGGAESGGVAISETVAGTAAATAGIEAGDVLVRIDDEPMDTANRVSDAILRHRPGDRIEVALLRDGELVEKVVTLGSRSESNRLRARAVIEVLDIKPGQVIADIGAGSGWLSEAIAQTLGTDGLVFAVEIQESRVRRLRRQSVPNVVPVFSAPDDVSLPANSLDTAMMHDVASHVERSGRPRFYESVARALKPTGRLVIFGPHGKARRMIDELREYGFIPLDDLEEADLDQRLQHGIVFRYTAPRPE